jgi:hypothetical protein
LSPEDLDPNNQPAVIEVVGKGLLDLQVSVALWDMRGDAGERRPSVG